MMSPTIMHLALGDDLDRILGYMPVLGTAALYTIGVSIAVAVLASLVGILLAIASRSHLAWVRAATAAYIQIGRAIPELVQLFLWYYLLAQIGIVIPPLIAGTIAISLAFAPFLAEVFRAGIEAVPNGQWEASEVLGMSRSVIWYRAILPQAIPIVLPVWTGYLISIFKATALLSFIAVPELFSVARNMAALNFRYLELFVIVAIFYLAMGYPSVMLLRALERRLTRFQLAPKREPRPSAESDEPGGSRPENAERER